MRINKLGMTVSLIGMTLVFLTVSSPILSISGTVRFFDASNFYDDLEWSSQGARVGLEVVDSDLNVIAKLEGATAEQYTLNAESTFFLNNVPVADRNGDGFINQRDISVSDGNGNPIAVDRASVDGRVDLISPHTGTVYVSYWASDDDDTGDRVSVKSLADPTGFTVALEETSDTSGVFRLVLDASERQSDPSATPPNLKVGTDDVITLTYRDADPDRTVSRRLYVEAAAPVFSSVGPANNSTNRANPAVQFDVTDADSGVDFDDIWVVFAIDADADGVIERTREYRVNSAPGSSVRNTGDVFSVSLVIPNELEVELEDTVYWWALAQDGAGNLGVLDRRHTIDGRDDPCSPGVFPRSSLAGVEVSVSSEVAGCQPYAVRTDYIGPVIERILTGPWWDPSKSDADKTEHDPAKARNDSILVDFSEEMDASSIQRFDFEVDGQVPLKAEVFDGRRDYVFLTVPPLAAGVTPNVDVSGEILDISGNRYRAGSDGSVSTNPAPMTSISSVELLFRVLREAESLGALISELADLLSDLFIEYLIVPVTGESPDEVRSRLSAQ